MSHTLTFTIADIDDQRATALRDRLAKVVTDEGLHVINATSAYDLATFTIAGVNIETREPFEQQVLAADEAAARAVVEAEHLVITSVTERA